jgi:hypothetical protein
MPQSPRSWSLLWLLVLAIAGSAAYYPGLRIGYYSDDFAYYFDPPAPGPLYFFTHKNPGGTMYRPLQSGFLAMVQNRWGVETLPIHLATLLFHILLSWLVALTVVRLGYPRLHAMIGSTFILLAQINTYAMLSNDTLSQIAGVFFGCLAGWLLYFPGRHAGNAAERSPRRASPLHYLCGLLSFAVSLLLKETSTAYLGIAGVALLAANIEQHPRGRALLRTTVQLLPFLLVVVAYMVVRSGLVDASPHFGDERYDLNLGLNIPKNIALFLVASSTAVSSVTSFVAMRQRNLPVIAAVVATILLFAGLLCRGLWKRRNDVPVRVLLILYFLGFLPAILFNRVSEHYIYNSLPFLAALVGIALGELWRASSGSRRIALGVSIALLLLLHVGSIESKTALMRANGERAAALLEQLRPIAMAAPANGTIHLVNPPNETVEYSIYIMNDFNILEAGFPGVQWYLGRRDLRIDIREASDSLLPDGNDSTLLLTLRDGQVVPYDAHALQ